MVEAFCPWGGLGPGAGKPEHIYAQRLLRWVANAGLAFDQLLQVADQALLRLRGK